MNTIFKNFLLSVCLTLGGGALIAQNISGKVSDADGVPLPGASVVVLETNQGVVTDFDGMYSIDASQGQTLRFSYVGFTSLDIVVGNNSSYDVTLQLSNALDEVVVTALGIKRNEKTLSYASQTVKADQITQARDINFANSLNGRAAGVEIRKSSSGAGGSTRIVLMGINLYPETAARLL